MSPRTVLLKALLHVGKPYVWGGKGLKLYDKMKGLVSNPWSEEVYDCSGLVTCAMQAAGGPDWRPSHSAQTLFNELPPADDSGFGRALFYGAADDKVTHVALSLGSGLVIEALGPKDCTSPTDARRLDAHVRVGEPGRHDFRGARLLVTPKEMAHG